MQIETMPSIALITDLGNKDYFVGAIKGAILSVNPEATIVDISHQIPKQDVQTAAFVLANAAETFPKGSIFIAVIDPGVGTERKCVLLRTENGLNFIGPDNGVFTLVSEKFGVKEIREVSNKDLMRSEISATFHGRDIMAPVGAHLSLGITASKVGPQLEELKRLDLKKPELKNGKIKGQILKIDDFGNLVTNIEEGLARKLGEPESVFKIGVDDREFKAPFVETFGEVSEGEKLCCIGSANLLEIAENKGNLAEKIGVKKNDKLVIRVIH